MRPLQICTTLLLTLPLLLLILTSCATSHEITAHSSGEAVEKGLDLAIRETSAWFRSRASLVREIQKDLLAHNLQSASNTLSSFPLGRYTYSKIPVLGATLPDIIRTAPGAGAELVYTERFGTAGFPFHLERMAICPSETKVALFGTIGPLSVLCIHEPTAIEDGFAPQKPACSESPQLAALAWSTSCQSLYFTEYQNGRASKLRRAPIQLIHKDDGESFSLAESSLLLDEQDAAFSISLQASEDNEYLLATSHSPAYSEITVFERSDDSAVGQLFLSRTVRQKASLHRAFDEWILIGDTSPNVGTTASAIAANVTTLPPTVDGTQESSVVSAHGFKRFLVLSFRGAGAPALAIIKGNNGQTLIPQFPRYTTTIEVSSVQDYSSSLVRVLVGTPFEPAQVCALNGLTAELACPRTIAHELPFLLERHSVPSVDGTLVPVSVLFRRDRFPLPSPIVRVYGAYGVSLDPTYNSSTMTLLDRGAILVYGHIRGGGERGTPWYHAGRATNRFNSVEDTLAVSRWAKQRWKNEVVLVTRSAGAVTANLAARQSLEMRELLFAGLILEAPFLDVLGTLQNPSLPSTVREYFEWGDPNDDAVQSYWSELAPSRSLKVPWTIPTLLSIGTADEAVSVSDATRWALQIRQARAPETPVLLQIEQGAGHLGATNASDRSRFEAQRLATVLSFANRHRSRDEGYRLREE